MDNTSYYFNKVQLLEIIPIGTHFEDYVISNLAKRYNQEVFRSSSCRSYFNPIFESSGDI